MLPSSEVVQQGAPQPYRVRSPDSERLCSKAGRFRDTDRARVFTQAC